MSNVLYPLSLIRDVKVTPYNRVLTDEFEGGTTATRLADWQAKHFKRKFELEHAPLTQDEYRWLRAFYSEQSGGAGPFWFRDNVNRMGNALVRFAAPVADQFRGAAWLAEVTLEEVAPVRPLPDVPQIVNTIGTAPCLWYDANREFYASHKGQIITLADTYDAANKLYGATWQPGYTLPLFETAAQYQRYQFTGHWAKTLGNIAEFTGAQPGCTIFIITKSATSAAAGVLFSLGNYTGSDGATMGVMLDGANKYLPWLGGAETWSGYTGNANSPNNTWRTVAVTWASGSNDAILYVNAALCGTVAETRNYQAGVASLGAAPNGTLKILNGTSVAHVLVFPAALEDAAIEALHNLLGYQYGIAEV
jgi:hypothetical protein